CPFRSTVAARRCVPPRSAAKISFVSVLSVACIPLDTHRQPDKLRHGPRQRCRRSSPSTNPNPCAISIPNLLGNHQSVIRESCQRIQPLARRCDITGRQLILTAFTCQQSPEPS